MPLLFFAFRLRDSDERDITLMLMLTRDSLRAVIMPPSCRSPLICYRPF